MELLSGAPGWIVMPSFLVQDLNDPYIRICAGVTLILKKIRLKGLSKRKTIANTITKMPYHE